nr:hypothetical protein Iba_scaffold38198CG0190 [Ipomoea batatas]GMD44300.1 hypothetical protein Iba_scaffold45876CG0010 [Ipomoea batatas]
MSIREFRPSRLVPGIDVQVAYQAGNMSIGIIPFNSHNCRERVNKVENIFTSKNIHTPKCLSLRISWGKLLKERYMQPYMDLGTKGYFKIQFLERQANEKERKQFMQTK